MKENIELDVATQNIRKSLKNKRGPQALGKNKLLRIKREAPRPRKIMKIVGKELKNKIFCLIGSLCQTASDA